MKVIFTENVPGVASRGDIKNVKNGYFRNFLLPRSKAIWATEDNLAHWEERRKNIMIEREQIKSQFEEIKRRVEGTTVKIQKKVTAKGTLYGGVKQNDVASAIKAALNVEIPHDAVKIESAIKTVGTYKVKLHLAEGVETMVNVEISEKK